MSSQNASTTPRPCIVNQSQDPETSNRTATAAGKQEGTGDADRCPRSKTLGSPRKLKQVHFKELDECLSTLSIADHDRGGNEPQQTQADNDVSEMSASSGSDNDDLPSAKKEKRLKVEIADTAGVRPVVRVMSFSRKPSACLDLPVPRAGSRVTSIFSRQQSGLTLELAKSPLVVHRATNSCGDMRVDYSHSHSSPGPHVPRTSCSTPGTATPSASTSPFSCSSLRDSSTASPSDRASNFGEPSSSFGETSSASLPAEGPAKIKTGGARLLYERRGRPSPLQLSVKRSRSVYTRTWTGKREQVLGAEPGTPRLSKCDTL